MKALVGSLIIALLLGAVAGPADAARARARTTRVLVIRAYWDASPPTGMTDSDARSVVLAQTNAWFRAASHGRYGVKGTVTPWLHIRAHQCAGSALHQITDQAIKAARAAHFRLQHYQRGVLVLPCQPAGEAGLGSMPGGLVWLFVGPNADQNAGDVRPTATTVTTTTEVHDGGTITDTDIRPHINTSPAIVVHEMGHNLGLHHADVLACTNAGQVVTFGGTCHLWEYGDPADPMGGHTPCSYDAFRLHTLGWLDGRVRRSGRPITARVSALTGAPGGTKAIRLHRRGGRTWWIDYRARVGLDGALDPRVAGVEVYYTRRDGTTFSVDADAAEPAEPTTQEWEAGVVELRNEDQRQLMPGSSITTPDGWTITNLAQDATAAQIQVTR